MTLLTAAAPHGAKLFGSNLGSEQFQQSVRWCSFVEKLSSHWTQIIHEFATREWQIACIMIYIDYRVVPLYRDSHAKAILGDVDHKVEKNRGCLSLISNMRNQFSAIWAALKKLPQKNHIMNYEQHLSSVFSCFHGQKFKIFTK